MVDVHGVRVIEILRFFDAIAKGTRLLALLLVLYNDLQDRVFLQWSASGFVLEIDLPLSKYAEIPAVDAMYSWTVISFFPVPDVVWCRTNFHCMYPVFYSFEIRNER